MVISDKLKGYLKDPEIQMLIKDGDFNSLYRDFNSKYNYMNVRELTKVLYSAGINPLLNQINVPDFFLYGSISLDQELKSLFKDFYIPEGIESIGYKSFKFCKYIEKIFLPLTLRFIDDEGLHMTSDLKEIHFNGTYEEWQKIKKAEVWTGVYSPKIGKDKFLICKDKKVKIALEELSK